jgi:hypothetical protein
MNLEEFPENVKKDIEDQSLTILKIVKDDIVVIGGWAVRALTGERHARYTLDVDGVTDKENIPLIKEKLQNAGLNVRSPEWGIQFYQKYEPNIEILDKETLEAVKEVELRVEISRPRIKEYQTHHYFDFSLTDYLTKHIAFHNKPTRIPVKVPPPEHMAAVKLGLPVDYKNNFDSAVILQICEIEKVIEIIKKNDDWDEMVLRRMPKLKGRIKDHNRLENMLSINAGIDIKDYVRRLEYIENKLKK